MNGVGSTAGRSVSVKLGWGWGWGWNSLLGAAYIPRLRLFSALNSHTAYAHRFMLLAVHAVQEFESPLCTCGSTQAQT
jgi:hypothetical protein